MKKRIITTLEIVLIAVIFYWRIYPDWSVKNATTGDFFCLEIIGMLAYNVYENLKTKIG